MFPYARSGKTKWKSVGVPFGRRAAWQGRVGDRDRRQGIGRGIALELARAGSDVVLTGRGEDKLKTVAAEIEALGRKATIHAADLTADAEPADLVAALEHSFGRLDILVCNAGAARRGNFFTLSDRDWNDGFALKFFAHVRLCRQVWPLLKKARGSVVFISGIRARTPVADYMIGASVIGASLAFMKALAAIGKKDRVQVNTVNPGSVDTDRFRHRLAIIMDKTGLDRSPCDRAPSQRARYHTLRNSGGCGRTGPIHRVAKRRLGPRISHRHRWRTGRAAPNDGL